MLRQSKHGGGAAIRKSGKLLAWKGEMAKDENGLDAVAVRAWASLLRRGRQVRFRAAEHLLRQGEAGDYVLFLLDGWVKIVQYEHEGNELLLAISGPGTLLGEISALDHGPRSATVAALVPSKAIAIAACEFRGFIRDCRLENLMLRMALAHQRESNQVRAELALLPVGQRLARLLLRWGQSINGRFNQQVILGLPQEDLARAIGASRSAVSAALARLRTLGIVTTTPRQITIRDPHQLQGEARLHGTSYLASLSTSGQCPALPMPTVIWEPNQSYKPQLQRRSRDEGQKKPESRHFGSTAESSHRRGRRQRLQ